MVLVRLFSSAAIAAGFAGRSRQPLALGTQLAYRRPLTTSGPLQTDKSDGPAAANSGNKRKRQPIASKTANPRQRHRWFTPPNFSGYSGRERIKYFLKMFVGGTSLGFIYLVLRAKVFKSYVKQTDVVDEDFRRRVFQVIAAEYDTTVLKGEKSVGILRLRQNLLAHAEGQVLELAAGTGVNFQFYNRDKVDRVVALDLSPNMVAEARKKKISLMTVDEVSIGNSEDLSCFPDASFDTVIDTFGLCSYEHPDKALAEMKRVLKDDGKILLLEHGLCGVTFRIMAGILNKNAERHAETFGCWWNRNIPRLIADADLDMLYFRMRHFRTVFFVICKKKKKAEKPFVASTDTPTA